MSQASVDDGKTTGAERPGDGAGVVGRRTLSRCGVELSDIGLGCGTIAGLYEPTSTAEAHAVIRTALDLGITYFDVAPFYGAGRAERLLGDAIRDRKGRYALSTKVGRLLRSRSATLSSAPSWRKFSLPPQMWVQALPFDTIADYSYDGVMRSFEDSQQRLGLSHIDLLLLHDVALPFFFGEHCEEIMQEAMTGGYRALEELRRSRDIGGFGLGVGDTELCIRALDYGDWDVFLLAGRYTLLEQGALEQLLPMCSRRQTGIIAGQPFNSGILAGKETYNHGPPPAEILSRAERIREICRAHDVPLGAAALQFPLGHSAVASVLPGPRTCDEVSAMSAYYRYIIPPSLWSDLRTAGLLPENAPVPPRRAERPGRGCPLS